MPVGAVQHRDFAVWGSYVQPGLLPCKGAAMKNFSSQSFVRKESRTYLTLHSNFTVCITHLVLLQWLQAEKGKDSVCYKKRQTSCWWLHTTPVLLGLPCLQNFTIFQRRRDSGRIWPACICIDAIHDHVCLACRYHLISKHQSEHESTLHQNVYLD